MEPDYVSLLALLGVLLVPAIVVLTIFTAIRRRRSKFHRQRITKNNS
jgi:hypothetical protein